MAKSISRYLADISSTSGVLDGTLSTAAQTNITSLGTLSSITVSGSAAMTLTTAAQPNITSLGTLTTLTVDDITINGSTVSDAGDFTLDVGGDIILDTDGGDIYFHDGGTLFGAVTNSSGFYLISSISDADIFIRGNDGGNFINAVTFDMSDAGKATFNAGATFGDSVNISHGTPVLTLTDTSSSATTTITLDGVTTTIDSNGTDGDIIFKGQDGGSEITALTLDMSDAGTAIFNHDAHLLDNGKLVLGTGADTQILYDGSRLNIAVNTGDIFIDASGVVLIGGVTNTAGGYQFKVGGSDNQGELGLYSSSGASDLLSYDRTNSHYLTLNIHAGNTNFTQGEVGIKSTHPSDTSWGAAGTNAELAIGNTSSGSAYGVLHLLGHATQATRYSIGAGDGKLYMAYDDVAAAHRIVVDSSGDVGIGITSPTSYYSKTLHIYGSSDAAIKLTNSDTGSGNGDGADIALDASEELRIMNRENNKINFWTNGNKALDIDGSGYITMPKQPFFQAHNGDGGSWQDVTVEQQWNTGVHNADTDFWTDGTDRGGNFAASTGRFTAPVSGWYQFNASLYVRNTSSTTGVYVHPQFMRNGILGFNSGSGSAYNIIACRANSGTEYLDVRVTQNIYCSATQYVEFKIYWSGTSSGTWDHYPQYAFFSGGLIS